MTDLKEKLLEQYKYKFELHAHSAPVSGCSQIPADEFASIMIEDGYDGAALTNHLWPGFLDKFESVKEASEAYLKDYETIKKKSGKNFSICLGVEMRFRENINDYLVYGVSENDIEMFFSYIDKDIDSFYKEIKNSKNLILQAHPFRDGMTLVNPKSLDGIEVFNMHTGHNGRIAKAAAYAKEHNMIISGGLDFHHEWQRKQFSLRCKSLPKDSYEVAELIKSGDFIFALGKSIILV